MAEISYYFPKEIWYLILQKLPSKTLCRFLSVCKHWCRLIKTEAFISSHLNQNLNTELNTHLLLRVYDHKNNGEQFMFYPFNQPKLEVPSFVLNPPVEAKSRYIIGKSTCYRIIGTCNGLICLMTNFCSTYSGIILWNPSIQKFVTVPEFSINIVQRAGNFFVRHVFGFGVNYLDNDFKVIRVGYSQTNMNWTYAEVYSLRRGAWREIQGFSDIFNSVIFAHQAYLNGRCHWIGHKSLSSDWFLISFDMSDEIFRQVLLPKELSLLDGEKNVGLRLTTISREKENECLAIIWRVEGVGGSEIYRIWMMSEYGVSESWSKLYDVPLRMSMRDVWFVGFIKNGGILAKIGSIHLACYNPEDESVVELNIIDSAPSMYVNRYVESLVLLNYDELSNRRSNPVIDCV